MVNLDRIFILGSGYSLKEGIDKGLFNLLKNETTIGINETIRFFTPTIAMYGDWYCYLSRYEWFSKHPLVIGRECTEMHHPEFKFPKQADLILLKNGLEYTSVNPLEKGLYHPALTGIAALSLAKALGFKQIFLLGYDNCAIDKKTHWYQDIPGTGEFENLDGTKMSGVGFRWDGKYKTSVYDRNERSLNELWNPFVQSEKDTSIVNVSLPSKINVFPKTSYDDIINMILDTKQSSNQKQMQKYIREQLQPYNQFKK